jgi:hypothetical protein
MALIKDCAAIRTNEADMTTDFTKPDFLLQVFHHDSQVSATVSSHEIREAVTDLGDNNVNACYDSSGYLWGASGRPCWGPG